MKIHMDRLQVRSNQPAKTETRVNIFEEVFKVLANVEFPQIYPDPESRFLRAKLVNYFTFIYIFDVFVTIIGVPIAGINM